MPWVSGRSLNGGEVIYVDVVQVVNRLLEQASTSAKRLIWRANLNIRERAYSQFGVTANSYGPCTLLVSLVTAMKFIKPAWLSHSGECSWASGRKAVEAIWSVDVTDNWRLCPQHLGEQKDYEVYSCHVSPDGSRLATAAGGKFWSPKRCKWHADHIWIDGHVRIWSTDAILHAEDPNYPQPKQLCHMSYHSGTIHTVRFSPNGRWLASGADDKIICIYHLDTNPPAHSISFGMECQTSPVIYLYILIHLQARMSLHRSKIGR